MKLWVVFVVLVAWIGTASAYAVGPAKSLALLEKEADLVVKATVIADAPVNDPSFTQVMGFQVREASMKVVSTLKGKPAGKAIRFRYYFETPSGPSLGWAPLSYKFTVGRSYIVFAAAVGKGVYKQQTDQHTMKPGQGVVLAADAKPHTGATVTEAVQTELLAHLKSTNSAGVMFAIHELDALSGGKLLGLSDLDRKTALAAIASQLSSQSDDIARTALDVFGFDSPYFDDEQAPFWLAGMGSGTIAGMGPRVPPVHPAAEAAPTQLLAVASKRPTLRALAIRALGRSRIPAGTLQTWAREPDPAVRAAATIVSADAATITAGIADPAPEVRRAAALAIGLSQNAALLPKLSSLLADKDPKVQQAAAMCILAFSVDKATPALTAALGTEWGPLFVNVLAKTNPKPHIAQLMDVVENQRVPAHWWGGSTPAGDSWNILYAYVKTLPPAELVAGKHDRLLTALEHMRWFSSSEPRDLYALYLDRKLTTRAKLFRATVKQGVRYDIDYFFNEADKDPRMFIR
jgi:hypothetical protein